MTEHEDFKAHAIQRAWERWKVELDYFDLNRMVGLIEEGRSLFQGYSTTGVEFHILTYKNVALPLVFHREGQRILTVRPNYRLKKAQLPPYGRKRRS